MQGLEDLTGYQHKKVFILLAEGLLLWTIHHHHPLQDFLAGQR